MVSEARPLNLKGRDTPDKSWLSMLLVCEQEKVARWKGPVLYSEIAMKGFGIDKNGKTTSLIYPLIPTVPDRLSLYGE